MSSPPPGTRAAVITVSDRSARGEREDRTGPAAVAELVAHGYEVEAPVVVPDGEESVGAALRAALAAGARLILTTGGTGVSPTDRTPEGTRPLLERELPGIAEALRREGALSAPTAVLSRGLAGVAGTRHPALVVNLPGSIAAVAQGLRLLLPLVPHVLEQLDGGDH